MNINEKYSRLFGHSLIGNRRLRNTQEVAEFICYAGEYGDVTVTDENGVLLLSTYGMYIDKIVDLEYRDELLKVLVPPQKEFAGDELCLNGGSEEFVKSLEEKVKEYIVSDAYKQDFEELKRAYIKAKTNKSDNEIMQEATGRFRTQCIKEAEADMHEKLSAEAEEYLASIGLTSNEIAKLKGNLAKDLKTEQEFAAEGSTAHIGSETTYVVVRGDSLWLIAKNQLGSGNRWTEIYALNQGILVKPELIFAGQVLAMPGR